MKILEYFKNQKEDKNFNLLPDGIFTIEQDGKIISVNNKLLEIFNTSRFNILGRYFSDFVEDGNAVLNKITKDHTTAYVKAFATKPKEEGEQEEEKQNIYLEISAVRNEENQKVYVCVRNASKRHKEQKIISEKYNIAQKIIDEKNEFLLNSSGTILSNLVSIAGFSRALLDGIGGALSDKQEKYLNIINTYSKDLNYDLEKLFALFRLESGKITYKSKVFDLISLIKSIDRVYKKDFQDKKIIYSLDYSNLTQRDCYLDSEVIEYILRCIMDIFLRFSNLGKCSLNIGHPPLDFLKTREFSANTSLDTEKYVLIEAKITDLVFNTDELKNIFDAYYKGETKRPVGLKATLNLLKLYICTFGGDIWVYSKENFGTMFTFVLPLR
ncbi:MAG: PAS domain-containing sensor histidine kinase [Candidatus Gastranaerophilales bacterium]|nr:PAS domain-containing sensor histidine kinase [Candidatus Gastranaerophilales bacterium]